MLVVKSNLIPIYNKWDCAVTHFIAMYAKIN